MKIHLYHLKPIGLFRAACQLHAGWKLCRKYGAPLRRYVPACINPMISVWNTDTILAGRPRFRTLLDVGANQSQMARLLLLLGEPGAEVLSFEPIPGLKPIGRRHVQALSDTDGTADFFIPGATDDELGSLHADYAEQSGRGSRTIRVQTARLETLAESGAVPWKDLPRPIFLKLDTEGSELKVLKGFGKYLKEVDAVLTEVENQPQRGNHYELMELCGCLQAAGFTHSRLTYACFDGSEVSSYYDLLFWRE